SEGLIHSLISVVMKAFIRISILAMFVSVVGCKSSSTSPNNSSTTPTTTLGTMSATVNGRAWKSDAVVGFRYAATATPNLQFQGWVTKPYVQLPFNVSPAITGPGTYPLVDQVTSLSEKAAEVTFITDTAAFNDNVSGSMTITVLTDKNVQGTLNFRAKG